MNLSRLVLASLAFGTTVALPAKLVTKPVAYEHEGVKLEGWLAYDDEKVSAAKPAPGVLVLPEWWGLTEYPKSRAEQLAKMGYVAFAADMYGAGVTTADPKKAGELAAPFYGKPLMAERSRAGLDQLLATGLVDGSRVAAIGYCFGGAAAQMLAYSGAPLAGIVSFHGSLIPASPAVAAANRAKFLVCHGAVDPFISAEQIAAFADAIDVVTERHRPFLRIMLGSILRDVSNVVVNGKGRKYRRGWEKRAVSASTVVDRMRAACNTGYSDIIRFSGKLKGAVKVYQGDARRRTVELGEADCAVFSPPYPNSFDYTDIYNLELWMLGYLRSQQDNRDLRLATMHSHVQLHRTSREAGGKSSTLNDTLGAVDASRSKLWHRGIPDMLRSYFADMEGIISDLATRIRPGGLITVIVGGSSYAGIGVDAPRIIAELGMDMGLELVRHSPLRAMRLSAQQGGQFGLSEDAVVFAC